MCRFAYEGEVIVDIVLYNLAKPLSSFYQEFMQFYMQSFTKTLLKKVAFIPNTICLSKYPLKNANYGLILYGIYAL